MLHRLTPHFGDPTCAAAVRAGGLIFLAHHVGDISRPGYVHQTRTGLLAVQETLRRLDADLSSLVQVTLWVRELTDEMRAAWDVFGELFGDRPPARMTATSDFFEPSCLVMIDGVAAAGREA